MSLLLYDVTTLYFEAENEDDLRTIGYSKERRMDPQIVVRLLVARTGFPLETGCFEGNTAETTTFVPIIVGGREKLPTGGHESARRRPIRTAHWRTRNCPLADMNLPRPVLMPCGASAPWRPLLWF